MISVVLIPEAIVAYCEYGVRTAVCAKKLPFKHF